MHIQCQNNLIYTVSLRTWENLGGNRGITICNRSWLTSLYLPVISQLSPANGRGSGFQKDSAAIKTLLPMAVAALVFCVCHHHLMLRPLFYCPMVFFSTSDNKGAKQL